MYACKCSCLAVLQEDCIAREQHVDMEKRAVDFMHFAILFSLDDLHILCTFMHVLKSALIIPQQSCRLSELTWLDVFIT